MVNKEVVVNLFRDGGYLWLGHKAVEEAGFKEGMPYYQHWTGKALICTLDRPVTTIDEKVIKRKVNQHTDGPVIRTEGTPVRDTFNGFKSVKATISPGRIEIVGYEKTPTTKEVLPDPAGVALALAGR